MIDIDKLEIGKIYNISHKRKGHFVGLLMGISNTNDDDTFLHVKYDTRTGTDQISLSLVPGKANIRETNLRAKLINVMNEFEGESWLRDVKIPKPLEPPEPKKQNLIQKITKTIKGD